VDCRLTNQSTGYIVFDLGCMENARKDFDSDVGLLGISLTYPLGVVPQSVATRLSLMLRALTNLKERLGRKKRQGLGSFFYSVVFLSPKKKRKEKQIDRLHQPVRSSLKVKRTRSATFIVTKFTSGNYTCIYMSDKNAFICH